MVRKGRVVLRQTAPLRRGAAAAGATASASRAGGPAELRLVVRHLATPELAGMRAEDKRVQVVRWQAGAGAGGTKVLLLQRGLLKLGYATPVSGYYDDGTARAVNAFRKVNNLGRDGYAARRRVRPRAARPRRVQAQVPQGRQARGVRLVAPGARAGQEGPRRTAPTTPPPARPATPTVFGTYRFYSQTPGTNAKGMVHSNYFIGGYAIHGYASVPNYPASHGCIRVPIPNALVDPPLDRPRRPDLRLHVSRRPG